jgi:hypothetical protein
MNMGGQTLYCIYPLMMSTTRSSSTRTMDYMNYIDTKAKCHPKKLTCKGSL